MENLSTENGIFKKPESRLERHDNVVDVHKPEGTYTIIYGRHDMATDHNLLPANSSGLVLETGKHLWAKSPGKAFGVLFESVQYSKLFEVAKMRRLPIYFVDTNVESSVQDDVELIEHLIIGVETGIGAVVIKRILERIAKKDKLTRRDFLGMGAKSVLAAWLGMSSAPLLIKKISHETGVGESLSTKLQEVSRDIHPEAMLFLQQIRNCVIAEKLEWIRNNYGPKDIKQKNLTVIVGAAYSGLEDMLRWTSKDRLEFLRSIGGLLKKIIDDGTFYSIGRFDYDGERWHATNISEIPALKEIVK